MGSPTSSALVISLVSRSESVSGIKPAYTPIPTNKSNKLPIWDKIDIEKQCEILHSYSLINAKIWVSNKYTKARTSVGLTQLEVANRAGLDRKVISRLENGPNIPSLENFLLLLQAIEVPPAKFFVDFDC